MEKSKEDLYQKVRSINSMHITIVCFFIKVEFSFSFLGKVGILFNWIQCRIKNLVEYAYESEHSVRHLYQIEYPIELIEFHAQLKMLLVATDALNVY